MTRDETASQTSIHTTTSSHQHHPQATHSPISARQQLHHPYPSTTSLHNGNSTGSNSTRDVHTHPLSSTSSRKYISMANEVASISSSMVSDDSVSISSSSRGGGGSQQQEDRKHRTRGAGSSSTSSTSSSLSIAAQRKRQEQRQQLLQQQQESSPRNGDAGTYIGPEKFAAKVSAPTSSVADPQSSSSSSGPGSDKEETPPPRAQVKPSRMVVKRRAPSGNSRSHQHHSAAPISVSTMKTMRSGTAQRSTSGRSTTHSQQSQQLDRENVSVSSTRRYENANSRLLMDSPPAQVRAGGSANMVSDWDLDHQRTRSGSKGRRKPDEVRSQSSECSSVSSSMSSVLLSQYGTPKSSTRKKITDDGGTEREESEQGEDGEGSAKVRPVRIRYETPKRGLGGKREISHASLGKLVARLTDAHQYDTEFRDVFLLTYRCFCTPYEFIKKLIKRYHAVLTLCSGLDEETLQETQLLLDQIQEEEENDRSSTSTSISSARSDINTGMEASVSIMRLLSVLKFWIKESGFIEMDLQNDRRSQKKLMSFLADIQSTSPVASIRKHAESLLLTVSQIIRVQNHQRVGTAPAAMTSSSIMQAASSTAVPPPPPLIASTSVSAVSEPVSGESSRVITDGHTIETSQPPRLLSAAMSKLKLSRSSSDPKRERSMIKLKMKHANGDIFQLRTRAVTGDEEPGQSKRTSSVPTISAPKISRGVTIGASEVLDSSRQVTSNGGAGWEEVIQDTLQRARLTAASRNSSRISYDNIEPLSGVTAQEMADQLTLMEVDNYFAKLNNRELTNKAWTRDTKHKDAPHVMALIELFDATAAWVSSEILHPRLQAVERAKIIMLFIDVADNCYQMNNFNTLFEITTGLTAPCIRQLNTTWGLVSAASQEKFQCLQQVCATDDNYRNYRQAFALAEGQPRLPCWFILVKDLFTYEEAMKSTEDGLVNWQKFRKIHRVISEALDRQNLNYIPANGSNSSGVPRKGKGILRHDRKVQIHIRHRLDTIRKDSSVLYQLARNANTQESILFVNSLSEAGFL